MAGKTTGYRHDPERKRIAAQKISPEVRAARASAGGKARDLGLRDEARRLYKTGAYLQIDLAHKYGVTPSAVRKWVRGVNPGNPGKSPRQLRKGRTRSE